MSKKTIKAVGKEKQYASLHPVIIALIIVQCLLSMFVILRQQTETTHEVAVEKIKMQQEAPAAVVVTPTEEANK